MGSKKFYSGVKPFQISKGFPHSENVSIEINPLSANPTKWSNTLKQFVGKLSTKCLSVCDHFVELALKELKVN